MKAPAALVDALADRYRLGRQLAAGGMATVYLARDHRHGREVAIKVLRSGLAETLGRERFLREIHLAARLNHPHILPLYDSGDTDGFLYFVMPVMATLADMSFDGHITFHLSESFAVAGDIPAALRLLARAVDNGFYPHDYIAVHCPFLAPLRGMAGFDHIVARAAERVAAFSA